MERCVLEALGLDLSPEVFVRLTLPELESARLVCKLWDTFITSAAFHKRLNVAIEASGPWVMLREDAGGRSCCWCPKTEEHFAMGLPIPAGFHVAAASGGLVCARKSEEGMIARSEFLVGNPITGKWTHVPAHWGRIFGVYMETGRAPGFRLLVENYLYDSRLPGGWQVRATKETASSSSSTTGMENSILMWDEYLDSVLAFDTQRGAWSKLQAARSEELAQLEVDPEFFRNVFFDGKEKRVLLASQIRKRRRVLGYAVWELVGSQWNPACSLRMERDTCQDFCRVDAFTGTVVFGTLAHDLECGSWSSLFNPGLEYRPHFVFMPSIAACPW